MSDDSWGLGLLSVVVMIGCFTVGFYFGKKFTDLSATIVQREAVERGVAEWVVVISKDGTPSTEFRWKEQPRKESAK